MACEKQKRPSKKVPLAETSHGMQKRPSGVAEDRENVPMVFTRGEHAIDIKAGRNFLFSGEGVGINGYWPKNEDEDCRRFWISLRSSGGGGPAYVSSAFI